MMVVPYQPEHLLSMVMQPAQEYLRAFINEETARGVAQHQAFTGMVDGVPIGCAGVIKAWEGRGIAWAFLAKGSNAHIVAITRAVRKFLDECGLRRVEMTVDVDFAEGHRWARMLGFRLEAGRMEGYRHDGGTCSLYARVRR